MAIRISNEGTVTSEGALASATQSEEAVPAKETAPKEPLQTGENSDDRDDRYIDKVPAVTTRQQGQLCVGGGVNKPWWVGDTIDEARAKSYLFTAFEPDGSGEKTVSLYELRRDFAETLGRLEGRQREIQGSEGFLRNVPSNTVQQALEDEIETAMRSAMAFKVELDNFSRRVQCGGAISTEDVTRLNSAYVRALSKMHKFYAKYEFTKDFYRKTDVILERISEAEDHLRAAIKIVKSPDCDFLSDTAREAKIKSIRATIHSLGKYGREVAKFRQAGDFQNEKDLATAIALLNDERNISNIDPEYYVQLLTADINIPDFQDDFAKWDGFIQVFQKNIGAELQDMLEVNRTQLLGDTELSREISEQYGEVQRLVHYLNLYAGRNSINPSRLSPGERRERCEIIKDRLRNIQEKLADARQAVQEKINDKYSDLYTNANEYEILYWGGISAAALTSLALGQPWLTSGILSAGMAAKGGADVKLGYDLNDRDLVRQGAIQLVLAGLSMIPTTYIAELGVGTGLESAAALGAMAIHLTRTGVGIAFAGVTAYNMGMLIHSGLNYGWSDKELVELANCGMLLIPIGGQLALAGKKPISTSSAVPSPSRWVNPATEPVSPKTFEPLYADVPTTKLVDLIIKVDRMKGFAEERPFELKAGGSAVTLQELAAMFQPLLDQYRLGGAKERALVLKQLDEIQRKAKCEATVAYASIAVKNFKGELIK